jgi:hypothetical protein
MGTLILGLTMALSLTDAIQQPLLEASVRVNPKSPSSGTVVKVESARKGQYKVWILSTGHFENKVGAKSDVEFFYMGGKKLDKPLIVTGTVRYKIEENMDKGVDFSVIEVLMDKAPAFVSISKSGPPKKAEVISCGCDLGSNPKAYTLQLEGYRTTDYKSKRNGPKAGRSGGGLFYEGELVGICWGHSGEDGYGLFTSHREIVRHLKKNGFKRLLR